MKKILILLLSLGILSSATAQIGFQRLSLEVLPNSILTITGDTNIRDFECEFNTSMLPSNNQIRFKAAGNIIHFENALLKLDNRGFDCGNKGINKDLHSLLKTSEYPEILLDLKELRIESSHKAVADVMITIAGKKKRYKVPVEIITGPVPQYTGKLILDIQDFNLKPPKKMLGLIVVKEDLEIGFNLNVLK